MTEGRCEAVGRQKAEEFPGGGVELRRIGDGAQTLGLVLGREAGVVEQAAQVGALADRRLQRLQVSLDGRQRLLLNGQVEESLCVALARVGRDGVVSHLNVPPGALFAPPAGEGLRGGSKA